MTTVAATNKIPTTFDLMLMDLYALYDIHYNLEEMSTIMDIMSAYLSAQGYKFLPAWSEENQIDDFEDWKEHDGDGVNSMMNVLNSQGMTKEKFMVTMTNYLKHIKIYSQNSNSI